MKHYLGIKTILIKVSWNTFAGLPLLFENLLQAKKLLVDTGLVAYKLPDGAIIELYGPGASYPPYLFLHGDIVIGYRVSNLKAAMAQLLEEGASILGNVVSISPDHHFCFLLINDVQVIGLFEMDVAIR